MFAPAWASFLLCFPGGRILSSYWLKLIEEAGELIPSVSWQQPLSSWPGRHDRIFSLRHEGQRVSVTVCLPCAEILAGRWPIEQVKKPQGSSMTYISSKWVWSSGGGSSSNIYVHFYFLCHFPHLKTTMFLRCFCFVCLLLIDLYIFYSGSEAFYTFFLPCMKLELFVLTDFFHLQSLGSISLLMVKIR